MIRIFVIHGLNMVFNFAALPPGEDEKEFMREWLKDYFKETDRKWQKDGEKLTPEQLTDLVMGLENPPYWESDCEDFDWTDKSGKGSIEHILDNFPGVSPCEPWNT